MRLIQLIRHLDRLVKDGGPAKEFAYRFTGAFLPPEDPHQGSWSRADKHWVAFNAEVMGTTVAGSAGAGARAVRRAERFAVRALGPMAELQFCPECGGPARPSQERLAQILREAERYG